MSGGWLEVRDDSDLKIILYDVKINHCPIIKKIG